MGSHTDFKRPVSVNENIAEADILNGCRISRTVKSKVGSKADAAVGIVNAYIGKQAVADFSSTDANPDSVIQISGQNAVSDRNILARPFFLQLSLVGTQRQRVVTDIDDTIAYRHTLAAVDIDTVVGVLPRLALDADAANLNILAAVQKQMPIRRVAKRNIGDLHVFAFAKKNHLRDTVGMRRKGDAAVKNRFCFVHPIMRIAVDNALALDEDVFLLDRHDQVCAGADFLSANRILLAEIVGIVIGTVMRRTKNRTCRKIQSAAAF